MRRGLLTTAVIGAAMILATSAVAQGRSGGHAGGATYGTPATPASGGVGRDFGTSVRDQARVSRQSSHANEHAVANANANAGLTGSATTVLDEDGASAEQCASAPGRSADAEGSPFNPDGQANQTPAPELPTDANAPITIGRNNTVACAHQPD